MRRTLFLIPHEIAGLPVFGVGWLLLALILLVVGRFIFLACFAHFPPDTTDSAKNPKTQKQRPRKQESGIQASTSGGKQWSAAFSVLQSELFLWLMMAGLFVAILPRMELLDAQGNPVGVAVRGYGAFLMLAAVGSVGAAAWRADRMRGLSSDLIFRLFPWTFIGGFLGARLFYISQYHQEFVRETWTETLGAVIAINQGGLVVYGGFLGGFIASCYAIWRMRCPLWRLGDAIVPCIFIGLCFGRLGCLMNGCCFGGSCDPGTLAFEFPPGSPVYTEQMLSGELIGLVGNPVGEQRANSHPGQQLIRVNSVEPNSLAASAGIAKGQEIRLALDFKAKNASPPGQPVEDATPGLFLASGGDIVKRFTPGQLPQQANPVVGTQVISAMVAAAMFIVLLVIEQFLHRFTQTPSGVLMLTGFIAYAILRMILEWVRVDEAGQFGTGLSISQWVSVGVIVASIVALFLRLRQDRGTQDSIASDDGKQSNLSAKPL